MAKVNLTAANDGAITVSSITVKRIGLSTYGNVDDGDDVDDIVDFEVAIELDKKKKPKPSNTKNIKLNNLDFSIIFDILKAEDTITITPESNLHPKRILALKILKTLPLSVKNSGTMPCKVIIFL